MAKNSGRPTGIPDYSEGPFSRTRVSKAVKDLEKKKRRPKDLKDVLDAEKNAKNK